MTLAEPASRSAWSRTTRESNVVDEPFVRGRALPFLAMTCLSLRHLRLFRHTRRL